MLGFNNVNPCGSFFVVSQRKGEEIVEEMKERDRGERKMNDSDKTENIPPLPLPAARLAGLAQL